MSSLLPPTTKMPVIKPLSPRRGSSGAGFGSKWRSFRRSVHNDVRSAGTWFIAICVGALTASVSWFGWAMSKISEAAVTSAEIVGRGFQEALPQENGGFWLTLSQVHPAWFIGVPAGILLFVTVIKEVK